LSTLTRETSPCQPLDLPFDKVILVSGDGDFYRMVEFLIGRGRFGKILHPNGENASSLYRSLDPRYYGALDEDAVRRKIGKGMRNAGPA
jgi:uncharacterized LabA/DUF88 family protein